MNNLKKLRLDKGLSQQALADKLEISQQSIYKYENQITEPNIDMLKHMAGFFDVSVDYLIGNSPCAHKIENADDFYRLSGKNHRHFTTDHFILLIRQYHYPLRFPWRFRYLPQ